MTAFQLLRTEGKARRGTLQTPHGEIQTPVFMNVATQAAIKGALSAVDLEAALDFEDPDPLPVSSFYSSVDLVQSVVPVFLLPL